MSDIKLDTTLSVCYLLVFQSSNWLGIMPVYYALFALGMVASEISHTRSASLTPLRTRIPWVAVTVVTSVLLFALLYKLRSVGSVFISFGEDALGGIVSASLLIALGTQRGERFAKWLSWRPLVFLGTFAYSIYLIHAPVIQIIWQYLIHPFVKSELITYLLMIGVGVPIAVLVSYLFFLLFERPFLNTPKTPPASASRTGAEARPAL